MTRRTSSSSRLFVVTLVVVLLAQVSAAASSTPARDLSRFSGMRYRLVGPFVGGRASAVAGVPGDPHVYYFGTAAGGVWKTADGGLTWDPIFDDQPIASIGHIAVAESDPRVVYVGTGESCFRADVSHGNGVYKSVDAGETWQHLGLEATRHIGRIAIHPQDPDVVFVAALGQAHGANGNPDRGVFRSTDGGQSWEKVLYVNDKTGAVDLSLDRNRPNVVFAATWEVYRLPWEFSSGGPGSGLYRSTDGGSTWERLRQGLPDGIMGKIAVEVSAADSNRVYALIEASEEETGLYRSDDGGNIWQRVSRDPELVQRPWYFLHLIADSKDPDVLYVPSLKLNRSVDGGRTWTQMRLANSSENIRRQYRPDSHDMWIAPEDPRRMANANDAGVNITMNGGKTWTRSDDNQPTGQFYHVAVDDRFPYYIYGAMQDYFTIALASQSEEGRITKAGMYEVGGCEMGYIVPSPENPDIVYSTCTDGRVTRYNHRTGRSLRVDPWPESFIGHGADEAKYRFNWTSPLAVSPHNADTMYLGANVLLRTTNGGQSWTEISPDLTRDDEAKQAPSGGPLTRDSIGPEYFDLVFTVAESPKEKGLIWVGTDDGLIHLTRDGGESWANVTPDDMPAWSRVSLIDLSHHEAGVAYAAVDRHQLNDYRPYIYKTTDYGESWSRVVEGIPDGSFVRAVREDTVQRGLLYAGTELGVYVSLDDGQNWQPLRLNLPTVPVHDLVLKGEDLIVGTHGRGIWILDDVTPLREATAGTLAGPVHLVRPAPAYRLRTPHLDPNLRPPAGENPPAGAIIYYYLEESANELSLTIRDAQGETVRILEGSKLPTEPGLHRYVLDARYPGPRTVPGAHLFQSSMLGPLVLPGTYDVMLSVDGQTISQPLVIASDPRSEATEEDLNAQFMLHMQIRDSLSTLADAINELRDVRRQLHERNLGLGRSAADREVSLLEASQRLEQKLNSVEDALTQPQLGGSHADAFQYGVQLDNKLSHLMDVVGAGADAAPPEQHYEVYRELWQRAELEIERLDAILRDDVPALNRLLERQGVPGLDVSRLDR